VSKDSLLRFWLVVAQLQTLPTDRLHQMLHQGKKKRVRSPGNVTFIHFVCLCAQPKQMRIPSDQFDTVDVSEVSWYGGVNSEKLEQQSPAVASSSLFSAFQLKLPQFRIRSPNGTAAGSSSNGADGCESSESNPTSPVLSRHGSERRKQTLAQPPQKFSHQTLSRHQSLSANNTPVRLVELVD